MSNKFVAVDISRHEHLVKAILNEIRRELDREYWNANQKEMESPFENSGADDFSTDYFTIRSYNWDENIKPNFETKDIKIWWYKHSNRGLCVKVNNINAEFPLECVLNSVLNKSIESINKFFKKKGVNYVNR